MMEPSLNQLEQEVRSARNRLAADLSTLRSPSTAAEFTESLKLEAMEAKDALLDKAKSSVQSSLEALIEDLKARAAANPAAALAIAGGLAWRLIRHPPIATALIGAGLLSLFRTSALPSNARGAADYFTQAKTRLMEQASETAEAATAQAAAVKETVGAKATETAGKIKERVQELAAQGASAADNFARDTREQAAALLSKTRDAMEQSRESARSAAASAVSHASGALDRGWQFSHSALSETEARDKVIVAAAGIAVAAALGLALQRRAAERAD